MCLKQKVPHPEQHERFVLGAKIKELQERIDEFKADSSGGFPACFLFPSSGQAKEEQRHRRKSLKLKVRSVRAAMNEVPAHSSHGP